MPGNLEDKGGYTLLRFAGCRWEAETRGRTEFCFYLTERLSASLLPKRLQCPRLAQVRAKSQELNPGL